MIKNIIFDLGNVILKGNPFDYLINYKDYDVIKNTFFSDWKDLDLGNITLLDKLNSCNLSNNLKKQYKELLLNYYKYREINIDLINLIGKLKDKGFNIYILSDNNWDAYNYYKNLDIFNNIDGWVLSCEYNTLKKDKKLFDILFSKYNLNSLECYYIDDKKENIIIGNSYGMDGFVFDNNIEELKYIMKKFNTI